MKNQTEHPGNEGNPLDDYFKNALNTYQPSPPARIWNQISRKLLYRELVRLNFTNIPKIIPITATVGVTLVALYFLLLSEDPAENKATVLLPANSAAVTSSSTQRASDVTASISTSSSTSTTVSSTSSVTSQATGSIKTSEPLYTGKSDAVGTGNATTIVTPLVVPVAEPVVSNTAGSENTNALFLSFPSIKPYQITGNEPYSAMNGLAGMNITKTAAPSFFSASFEVSPEMTYHDASTASSQEVTYWTRAGITYHFSRFTLSTGLGYGYSTTEQNYRVNYRSNDSIGFFTSVVSFYVNPYNPSEVIFNTKNTTVYDSVDHLRDDRARNRYSYLRVPLLIGFDLMQTNRLTLNFNAGPALTFMIGEKKAEAYIDYPNSRIIRIDSEEPARIKTGLQIWTGLRLDYQLVDNFSIYAEPTFKYYIRTSYKQDEIPVADEPYSVGLGVGIQYNFGKKK